MRAEVPPWPEFLAAIRKGQRVILTRDKAKGGGEDITFERTGHVAIFTVGEVVAEGRDLKFRFVERVQDLQ